MHDLFNYFVKYRPSDHCPITATIRLNLKLKVEEGHISLEPLPDSYIWEEESSQTFQERLAHEDFKTKVDNLLLKEDLHVSDIKELLHSAAKESNIKMTNNKRKARKHDPPWFDKNCKTMKKEITSLGKKLRTFPDNVTARERTR